MTAPTARPGKTEIRADILARRRAIDAREAAEAASAAARHALDLLGPVAGRDIALYAPVRGELDTNPLAESLRERGATVLLPTVVDRAGCLVFREWAAADPLERGYGAIPEPDAAAPIRVPVALVVPLAAFDRRGYRVGYGQGHYDRTLEALARMGPVPAIGFAFAFQEVARVPDEAHDVPLDAVATEREPIRARRA